MSKTQTAVKWMYLELIKYFKGESRYGNPNEIYMIAEEINKYQIINANIGDECSAEHIKKAQQYYEQKFGGNK